MNFTTRRLSAAVIAAAVIVSMGLEPAFSQVTPSGPTVGPARGVGTTTAPSNSEGTPSGGTGTMGTTRVGPSGVAPAPMPMAEPSTMAPAKPMARRRRRYRRRPVRPMTPASGEVGTQSQMGTNGSVPPAK